jgi:hypothetical protein
MATNFDFFALMRAGKEKPLLDVPMQRALVRQQWTEIHQSDLSKGRECPWSLHLSTKKTEQDAASLHAFLGSIFHAGLELGETVKVMNDFEFWLSLMQQQMSRGTYRIEEHQLIDLAQDITTGRSIGLTMCDLVYQTWEELARAGIEIISIEERMEIVSGLIRFVGTLDMRAMLRGQHIIIDVKTSGLWGAVINGASIKKQGMSLDELFCHTQLKHYDWMGVKLGKPKASMYALLTPANLVPYTKNGNGYKKGERRGSLLNFTPAASDAMLRSYELDIIQFLRSYVAGPYRAYPTNFGTPLCPGCRYYGPCMKDTVSNLHADALADAEFDYLKESE